MADPRRILLLAMLPIGDTLFLTPTLRALRARYPSATLTALGYASNAPILRATGLIDDLIELPPFSAIRSAPEYLRLLSHLRQQAFDVAVDFTSPAFKWIAIGAGIQRRTYMKFDPGWWLLPGRHETWRQTHATQLYYDCVAELDLPPWDLVDHRPQLDVPAAAHAEADAFIARAVGGPAPARLVALHPGGKGLRGQKRWRPERFAAVADALGAGWDACVLLLGGRDEQPLTREVAARMSRSPVLAAGHLSLLGTVALMARCDLFIGNDSSPLHLAACQGTPYVGIFGPTSLANFEPIPFRPSQGRLAVASPAPRRREYFVGARPIWYAPISPHAARAALDSISSDLVLGYANELLAKHAASTAAHEADMHPMVQDAGVS